MFYVYVSYIVAMAIGITVLAILFKRDCREAERIREEQEEDNG